jgi:hypothetical protein
MAFMQGLDGVYFSFLDEGRNTFKRTNTAKIPSVIGDN